MVAKHKAGMFVLLAVVLVVGMAPRDAPAHGDARLVRVTFRARIDRFHSAPVSVSGTTARRVEVRLLGAIDVAGLAYRWTPYRWRSLRLRRGAWRGALPPPALFGIYQLQIRFDGRACLSSRRWLLKVFPRGAATRRAFATPIAAVRDYVAHLPGHKVLVALKRWPLAEFDHRDPRLHRLFVIAYAPRGDDRASARLGTFLTVVREGFHGRWRLLDATTGPYG